MGWLERQRGTQTESQRKTGSLWTWCSRSLLLTISLKCYTGATWRFCPYNPLTHSAANTRDHAQTWPWSRPWTFLELHQYLSWNYTVISWSTGICMVWPTPSNDKGQEWYFGSGCALYLIYLYVLKWDPSHPHLILILKINIFNSGVQNRKNRLYIINCCTG